MIRINNPAFKRKKGLPPGSLLRDIDKAPGRIRLLRYSGDSSIFLDNIGVADLPLETPEGKVDWIQLIGVHDVDLLSAVGDAYDIHSLTLEDIQNTDRRPGIEGKEGHLFMTLKKLHPSPENSTFRVETISAMLIGGTLISFHEENSTGFAGLENHLAVASGRLRNSGADYLAYSLLDDVVDSWLLIIEDLETGILKLEEDVLFRYQNSLLGEIHDSKKRLAWLRWLFRPYRFLRSWLIRESKVWFTEDTQPYLSDVADHADRVLDLLDLYRDMAEDLLTVHMSVLSNRMNSVMKVLTVIATIFIPLTFIAGVYGMNFVFMPELSWKWGYAFSLGLMAATALGMVIYFKRKKWL